LEHRSGVYGRAKRLGTNGEILASQHFGDYFMRKTQMALAAVALVASSAALAQVTASGSVDIGVGTFNSAGAPGTNNTGLQEGAVNGGSIFTVSGSDDLGGGMKASFTLQHGFNAATGAISNGGNVGADNATFNRQANVALSGAFGTITLGNQLNAYIPGAAGTTLPGSMFGAFDVAAIVGSGEATGGGGNAGGFFTRDAITYASPDLGGMSFAIQQQVQGQNPANFAMTAANASAKLGDVKASFGWIDRSNTRNTWTLGASAPIGPVTANLRYTSSDPAGAAAEVKQWRGGVSYALTEATTLTLQHATNSGAADGALTSLGALYSLSKATSAYVHYSGSTGGFAGGGVYGSAFSTTAKGGNSAAVGIVTNF
jgi:predicted porin